MAAKATVFAMALALLLTLAGIACASDANPKRTTATPTATSSAAATQGEGAGAGPAAFAEGDKGDLAAYADSVRHIVESYRIAIIATPTGAREWEPVPHTVPYTIYDLDVEEVISGSDVATSNRMGLILTGGTNEDGTVFGVSDPPVIGARYLFLLADDRVTGFVGFSSPGFARFQVSQDDHIIPNGYEAGAGIRAISGVTNAQYDAAMASADPSGALRKLKGQPLADAESALRAALSEGPVPSYPAWWMNTVSPASAITPPGYPTPTLTATPAVTRMATSTPPAAPSNTPTPSVVQTAVAAP